MITLYQFSPRWGLPNVSPFCLKLETYLRMAGLPFEIKYVNDTRKAPKSKLPFIKDGNLTIGDTDLIISYLKATYGDTLDNQLTPLQQAQSLAMRRLVEDHLYWIATYSRWIDPPGWAVSKLAFFDLIPKLLRNFVANVVQKNVKKQLYSQGIGRHSRDEIYQLGKDDLKAIAVSLGEQKFFMGDQPTSIDASLYGLLANILFVPVESPLKKAAETWPNLRSYCERMREKYYSP